MRGPLTKLGSFLHDRRSRLVDEVRRGLPASLLSWDRYGAGFLANYSKWEIRDVRITNTHEEYEVPEIKKNETLRTHITRSAADSRIRGRGSGEHRDRAEAPSGASEPSAFQE